MGVKKSNPTNYSFPFALKGMIRAGETKRMNPYHAAELGAQEISIEWF